MEPGDVAIWNPFTVHGSLPNRSVHVRRVYINGFAQTRNCDHGIEVLRGGETLPLRWGPETLWDQVEEK
jgi:ectoine hydroxylase-related dioxygenase (phytanoyl-CoA dioxygenase family)